MSHTYGSLFTGVGGFDLGMDRSGWTCAWQVEIDKQCRQVLRRHWPDVPRYEDVRNVGVANLSTVDLITFGSPCQGLSVAGKRKGLADDRSGLFIEAIRIIDELAPRWVLFENVPGLLSSEQGEDFAVCLEGFTGWRPAVPEDGWRNTGFAIGPRYGISWRVCDSQFWGVAQRRRRVFIVGRAGGFCPPEILLEPESVFGDSAPSREAREGVTPGTSYSLKASGGNQQDDHETYVAHTLRAEGFDASEDGTGRGTPIVADTLVAGGRELPPHGAGDGKNIVAFHHKASAHQSMNPSEVCPALGATKEPAVFRKAQKAHDPEDFERWEEAEYANTLNGRIEAVDLVPLVPQSLAVRGRNGTPQAELGTDGQANALLTPSGGRAGVGIGAVLATVPRRLTPTECERLQGFPDGWTEGLADGPRYRCMGNAVTVPVIEYIGHRIMKAIQEDAA